jgi:hypothetical protein
MSGAPRRIAANIAKLPELLSRRQMWECDDFKKGNDREQREYRRVFTVAGRHMVELVGCASGADQSPKWPTS